MQTLFVVALQAEATAIIKFYHLKLYCEAPFKIYKDKNTWLIISGVGRINSAAATSYLYSLSVNDHDLQLWINIGIGGHKNLPLGTTTLAHKITDAATQKIWYPPLIVNVPVSTMEVTTVDIAETNYPTNCVYEMEAASFYSVATKFSTSEFVHCFKIISDNEQQHIENITRQKIIAWIESSLPHLDNFCHDLCDIAAQLPPKTPYEWQDFLETWNFTDAGKKRLRNLLRKWDALHPHTNLIDIEIREKYTHMKQILRYIETKVQQASRSI